MRIIAGIAKGRKLQAVPGKDTRPLTDRVKESLFSILQPEMGEARILDLYSGSGAFVIEAVSRGAAKGVCVERSRLAAEVCRTNVQTVGFGGRISVVQADVASWAKAASHSSEPDDIVFADPTFLDLNDPASSFFALLSQLSALTAPEGIVVIRTHERVAPPQVPGMGLERSREIGISTLHFYRHQGATK